MFLLDVLPVDPDRVRRIREIKPVIQETVKDSLDTIKDSIGATKDAIADSAAQAQLILDNATQDEASLVLPIAVVAVALAGCLYMAHLYRKRRLAV
jgi:hypothetical protein